MGARCAAATEPAGTAPINVPASSSTAWLRVALNRDMATPFTVGAVRLPPQQTISRSFPEWPAAFRSTDQLPATPDLRHPASLLPATWAPSTNTHWCASLHKLLSTPHSRYVICASGRHSI